ncbi:hypothetical protein SteCoe_16421 [Stentor coeruleus]|uniref:Dickkopf N-terminal cysteine-rich domain-containing protein n=1 Tax=Stentor coeruleus TaxID=5963 RepID=A0A1R2C174_9CILI|nr:hypothetical protein SteCoe_16421 [Stentor coeruleus]
MLIFLLSLHQAIGRFCSGFSCASILELIDINSCIYQVGDTFELSICIDEFYSYCSPNKNNTQCTLPPITTDVNISYPGEPCFYDRSCQDSICVNSICQGLDANMECDTTNQCNPGLYCNITCQPLSGIGAPCLNNQGQFDDSICLYNLLCHQGVCTEIFSFDAGSLVDECDNNISLLCKSGYCIPDLSGDNICVGIYPTNGSLPKKCSNNGDCVINDPVLSYTTTCDCGYNTNSDAFCGLGPGDKYFVDMIDLYKIWLNSKNVTNCNTKRRLEKSCYEFYGGNELAINLTYYSLLYSNYAGVQENDKCVKEIYMSDYWNAYEDFISQPVPEKKKSSAVILVLASLFYMI